MRSASHRLSSFGKRIRVTLRRKGLDLMANRLILTPSNRKLSHLGQILEITNKNRGWRIKVAEVDDQFHPGLRKADQLITMSSKPTQNETREEGERAPESGFGNEQVEALFGTYHDSLLRFLFGILKDHSTSSDALQATFSQLIKKGAGVETKAMRSWLFRVAFNEAMLIKRKSTAHQRKVDHAARALVERQMESPPDGLAEAIRQENIQRVRSAVKLLPEEQRRVVLMRMYEGKKFKDISSELELPLGTVLSRMQLALKKLGKTLSDI